MSDFDRGYARPIPAGRADMAVDAGLRAFMLGVYNKVALGLLVSAALAFVTGSFPPVRDLMFVTTPTGALRTFTTLGWIVSFAPLAILLFSAFAMRNASPRAANLLYWVVVALLGASMGTLVLMYTGVSIVTTFLITASAFGALSLFGYSTKANLSGLRSFLIMGVWGLLIAMIVGALASSFGWFAVGPMFFIINALGVLIFAGLIAADTQHLKMMYYQLGGDQAAMSVATSYGALNLYLDFINLFTFLLRLTGSRR